MRHCLVEGVKISVIQIDEKYLDFFEKYCINPEGPGCMNCPYYMECRLPKDFKCKCKDGKDVPDCEFHTRMEIILVLKGILNGGFSFYDEYYRKLNKVEEIVRLRRTGHKIKIGIGVPDDKWNMGYM